MHTKQVAKIWIIFARIVLGERNRCMYDCKAFKFIRMCVMWCIYLCVYFARCSSTIFIQLNTCRSGMPKRARIKCEENSIFTGKPVHGYNVRTLYYACIYLHNIATIITSKRSNLSKKITNDSVVAISMVMVRKLIT